MDYDNENSPVEIDLLFELLNRGVETSNSNCPENIRLAAYYDQVIAKTRREVLSAKVTQSVKEHLAACADCQMHMQHLSAAHSSGRAFVLNHESVGSSSAADAEKAGAVSLPAWLAEYSRRHIPAAVQKDESGILSVVVQMARDSFHVFHNGMENLNLYRYEGVALRGPREYPSFVVEQKVETDSSSDAEKISYKIYRETEEEVMLSVKLDDSLLEDYNYIKLKKEDRVISSRQINGTHPTIFNHLRQGNYLLELIGSKQHSMKMALV